jgi:hypothetical protein
MQNTNAIENVASQPHLYVGNLILVGSIAIAVGIVLVIGFCVVVKWSVAWKLLVRKFPVTDIHKLGKKIFRTEWLLLLQGQQSCS